MASTVHTHGVGIQKEEFYLTAHTDIVKGDTYRVDLLNLDATSDRPFQVADIDDGTVGGVVWVVWAQEDIASGDRGLFAISGEAFISCPASVVVGDDLTYPASGTVMTETIPAGQRIMASALEATGGSAGVILAYVDGRAGFGDG